jgi:5-methylcytosine-specific restriction endonuclease McrA
MPKAHPRLYDKDWLEDQYITHQRTYEQIGEQIGVSKHSIKRAMERLDIPKRRHTSKYTQLNDKDWLRRMYIDEFLSTKQIADLLGTTIGNVYSALKHCGVRTRTYSEGQRARFPDGNSGEKHPRWTGGLPVCIDCGQRVIRRDAVRCKSCNNISRLGEGNTNWRGGVTAENRLLRSRKDYKLWKSAVLERDEYTCRFCGKNRKEDPDLVVHADHIKPFAYFPELRLNLDNGRCLCVDCHRKTSTWGGMSKEARNLLTGDDTL